MMFFGVLAALFFDEPSGGIRANGDASVGLFEVGLIRLYIIGAVCASLASGFLKRLGQTSFCLSLWKLGFGFALRLGFEVFPLLRCLVPNGL